MKKNLLKIPDHILAKIKGTKSNSIVVAFARVYKAETIKDGCLTHLGIKLTEKGLTFPRSILPKEESGKYSLRNIYGQEIVRRDLPKETHYHTVETPNWGDSYYGTHDVNLPYEKYPREFIAPRLNEILIECNDTTTGKSSYLMKFEINEVMDKRKKDFHNRLLFCLNLLTENTGHYGVEEAGTPISEYLKTLQVSWELLPPGTQEEALARLSRGKTLTEEERKGIADRYDFLIAMKPKNLIYGTSGLQRYFGAQIKDDVVVFENIEYGNAIYVMYENWRELSQRSRLELLSGRFGNKFNRIIHRHGWKKEVKEVLRKHVKDQIK